MTDDQMTDWLIEHKNLFRPTNKKPTQEEARIIFEIANSLDSSQTHKMTSCGRCYYNALRAIERAVQIF